MEVDSAREDADGASCIEARMAKHAAKMRQMLEEKTRLEEEMSRLRECQQLLARQQEEERARKVEAMAGETAVDDKVQHVTTERQDDVSDSLTKQREPAGVRRCPNPPKTVRVDQSHDFRAKHLATKQKQHKDQQQQKQEQRKQKQPYSGNQHKAKMKDNQTRPALLSVGAPSTRRPLDASRKARDAVEWAERRKIAVLEAQRIRKLRSAGLDPFKMFSLGPFIMKKNKVKKASTSSPHRKPSSLSDGTTLAPVRPSSLKPDRKSNASTANRPKRQVKSKSPRSRQVRIVVAAQPLHCDSYLNSDSYSSDQPLFTPPRPLAQAAFSDDEEQIEEYFHDISLSQKDENVQVSSPTPLTPQENLWTCSDCRFENAEHCLECVLCGKRANSNKKDSDNVTKPESAAATSGSSSDEEEADYYEDEDFD